MEIKKEKAILAGLAADVMPQNERSTETSMEELAALVETAGGEAVAYVLQSRPTPDARKRTIAAVAPFVVKKEPA